MSARIVGIDPDEENKVLKLADHMVSGEYLDGINSDEIVLGADTAGGYGEAPEGDLGGVKVGDEVQVNYSNTITRIYKVKGIYKIGFYSGLGIISSQEAESILSVHDSASQIFVKVNLDQDTIDNYLESVKGIAPNLEMRKYSDLLGEEEPIITALDAIALVVSAVSVVVAAITIFALIYVNAYSKRRQIGILKAIGIKQRVTVYSYIFQSIFYTLCGIIVGSVLVFLLIGPFFESHPLELPMGDVSLAFSSVMIFVSILSLLVAGILAGLIPSWRVAKQNILKAIGRV